MVPALSQVRSEKERQRRFTSTCCVVYMRERRESNEMMNPMPTGGAPARAEAAEEPDGYTRIGDMAREFGVTLRALRFYEDRGLLHPKRVGAARLYSRRDRTRLRLILLGRKVGFSLREVKYMLDLYDPAGTNARQLRVVLQKSEKQLANLERQRAELDEAIAQLGNLLEEVRTNLHGSASVAVKN